MRWFYLSVAEFKVELNQRDIYHSNMDNLAVLMSISLIWGAAALIPGPDFVAVVQATLSKSRAHGIMTVLGVAAGTVIWGAAGFIGIGALFIMVPWLYIILKVVGGGYLIYLGVGIFRRGLNPKMQASMLESRTNGTLLTAWVRGLTVNLSNPKTAIFVASIFATTLPPEPGLKLGLSVIALTTSISTSWYLIVALLFASPSVRGAYTRGAAFFDKVAGGVLVLFGSKLALDR